MTISWWDPKAANSNYVRTLKRDAYNFHQGEEGKTLGKKKKERKNKMFGPRNDYLRLAVKEVKPEMLDRLVNQTRKFKPTSLRSEPPLILSSAIPLCFGPDVDVTRCRTAYGRWALPKLRRELHDENPIVVRCAINTLCDLVHDPEKTFEAVRLNVIKRVQDLCRSPDEYVRERCAMLFITIAGQAEGCNAILSDPEAMHNLALLLEDTETEIRFHAALAVYTCASSFSGAKALNEAGFIPLLIARVLSEVDYIAIPLLETLKQLLDQDEDGTATQLAAVETMTQLIGRANPEIVSRAASCIAELTKHWRGKCLAMKQNQLMKLKELLDSEIPEVHTKAAGAIMFITITTASRLKAIELGIIPRLIVLAHNFHNQELQINCVKALTNIAEAPQGRKILRKQYKKSIENILTTKGNSEAIDRHIKTLLDVILWDP